MRKQAEALFDEQTPATDPERLAQEIDDLLRKAEDLLSDHLKEANPDLRPAELVRQIANETATNLSDGLRFLPDSIVVPVSQVNTAEVDPREGTRDLPFREIVLRSVDVLRLEAIRKSPDPLLRFLDSAKGEGAEIPAIVTYNLSAAANELREPPDGPREDLLSNAHSLTVDGLARTEKGVGELVGGMATAWREFTEQVHHLLQESYQEIHAQVVTEGVVQEQMLSLRSQLRSRLGAWATQLRTQVRKLGRRLDRILRRLRVRGLRLVRLGRSAVGAPLSQRSEAERALEILRGIPQLLESLPLVYRRLYSFHPVTDAGFLVGREKEMEWATRRVDAWQASFGTPAVMVGPVGAGNTSVLNVLSTSLLEDFQVCRMEFKTRIHTSEGLATLLAEALGLEEDERWTLSRLAKRASSRPQGEKPWAILVEHLEHLLLRAPGGTSLLEAFFSFQAQTAKDIFWLSTTSGATWKLVQKTEPLAAGLLTSSGLSVLTKNDVARLILSRHRRSGLPLEFLQPHDSNPLLRRRLRRTRGEDQKQEILRDEYFDRIYRMSEGSIAMAILLWLRSADFTSREGWLRISAPRPIRFAFLEELDLQMEFALKAFLEHGSLNLEEYGLIFQASRDEAFQVFETLQSRVLIEPVGARGSLPAEPIAVTDGERYRIPGLLSQVVATRLKNRNILH